MERWRSGVGWEVMRVKWRRCLITWLTCIAHTWSIPRVDIPVRRVLSRSWPDAICRVFWWCVNVQSIGRCGWTGCSFFRNRWWSMWILASVLMMMVVVVMMRSNEGVRLVMNWMRIEGEKKWFTVVHGWNASEGSGKVRGWIECWTLRFTSTHVPWYRMRRERKRESTRKEERGGWVRSSQSCDWAIKMSNVSLYPFILVYRYSNYTYSIVTRRG